MSEEIQWVVIMMKNFDFKKRLLSWNYIVIAEGVEYGIVLAVILLWCCNNVPDSVNKLQVTGFQMWKLSFVSCYHTDTNNVIYI